MATRAAIALALAAVVVASGTAWAAISWTSAATVVVGVGGPPTYLDAGVGATKDRYIGSFTLSANLTSFSATLHPRFGAAVNVKDVFRVVSNTTGTNSVTLSGTQVGNAQILVYTWTVKDGSTTVATLDMKGASPGVTFALPASASYKVDLRIQTADGAGANNADLLTAIGMRVSG